MNERLDPRLSALLQAERRRADPAATTKNRVWARVHTTLAPPPPHSSNPTSGSPAAGSLASAVMPVAVSLALLGGAAGAMLAAHGWRSVRPAVSKVAPQAEVPTAPSAAAASSVGDTQAHAISPTDPLASPRASSSSARPSVLGGLAGERVLLDQARHDLLSGEAPAALTSIAEHARRFPRGVLSEERDALRVEALVAAARYDEARAAVVKFHRAHPDSVLTPAVDDALGTIP